ncbi:MAG: RAMP superfamily CRISPR-associated protein [Gemmatales bacterium]|nr:RAMP superfamily CRISPR-associated protein [Gemmatales bacterium]MCS7159530.1 RAMP superfamily CRISPR-associated protein [Gemmatales bacterium]MDW8174729.1 RAMP superfamily CRISPR-associated protein [Gemmatales bacterium]MDW8221329.1 RAMP superfamily CRISPR-associated protein [Gemmatales bacterium]
MSQPSSRRQASSPKPFVWIPVSGKPRKSAPTGLEVFRQLTGRLDVSFSVESAYLYVGSGAYDFKPGARQDEPEVWYTFYRRHGQLCVPGTSLKGAIRALVEAMSNSCISQAGSREYVQPSHQRCGENDQQVCVSCNLFGRTGWRGRVHFADALPEQEVKTQIVKINELWPPRLTRGRKFYSGQQFQSLGNLRPERNHRFVEAVPRGTNFRTTVFFENVRPEELGLVCCGLGWDVDAQGKLVNWLYPKVGGAKPRCFGMIRFLAPSLKLWSLERGRMQLGRSELSGQQLLEYLGRCIQQCKASDLFDKNAWETLCNELKKGIACPRGLY